MSGQNTQAETNMTEEEKRKVIHYSPEELSAFATDYTQCAEAIDAAIVHLFDAHTKLTECYTGFAEEVMVKEAYEKLAKHLELLSLCCASASTYVKRAKQIMGNKDSALSQAIERA